MKLDESPVTIADLSAHQVPVATPTKLPIETISIVGKKNSETVAARNPLTYYHMTGPLGVTKNFVTPTSKFIPEIVLVDDIEYLNLLARNTKYSQEPLNGFLRFGS
jgi:3'-phosphoadenosine 5'-phosphosulfate (PAPS) 3'-phosphatase